MILNFKKINNFPKMKFKIILSSIIFFSLLTFHFSLVISQPVIQEWVRRYPDTITAPDNGGGGYAIITDNKGNIYATGGATFDTIYNYYCTIKYNAEGDVKWVNLFPHIQMEGGRWTTAISMDKFSNVFVTGGSVEQNNQAKFLTIKYDSPGNEI